AHFQRALLLDRDNPIIYFNLARAYVNLNEDKKALEVYFSAIIRDPKLAELFWSNGIIPDLHVEHTLKFEILNFAAESGDNKAAEALKNNSWI
ncbi:MAG: tetratricopeptide repeat protein, partial [Syntrophothermus sp.]